MLIIPRWLGKKGLIAMGISTLVVILLVVVLVQEYRNRNQRIMGEIYEGVGFANFTEYSKAIVFDRDPGLFPLKSRKEIDQFLRENSDRLNVDESGDALQIVQQYDQEFLEVVQSSPARSPMTSEMAHLEHFNFTGVRSRLISLFSYARFMGDCSSLTGKFVAALEANENLCSGGTLVEELVRQAILKDFLATLGFYLQSCKEGTESVADLRLLLKTLEKVESPLESIKRSLITEILGSIELVNVNRSEVFPSGVLGYVFEPDIYFYLTHQQRLLADLDNIETLTEFSPLPEFPWYAIYTKILLLGETAMNNALANSRASHGLLEFTKDCLRAEIHWKTTGEHWSGPLSRFSRIEEVTKSDSEQNDRNLIYSGPELPPQWNGVVSTQYRLP